MDIKFFMPMVPPTVTSQQKRAVRCTDQKIGFYDSDEIKAAKNKLQGHLLKHKPATPINGAIRLIVKWCYPTRGKHGDGEYKVSAPDLDNANKLLQDCMTKVGFWKNDAQVASLICEKFWADIPGIFIAIQVLTGKEGK